MPTRPRLSRRRALVGTHLEDLLARATMIPSVVRTGSDTGASDDGPDGRRILEAIGELPEDSREVFDLVRIQGMAHAESARVLGISTETVRRRLNRGLWLLAEQLAGLRPDEKQPDSVWLHTGRM